VDCYVCEKPCCTQRIINQCGCDQSVWVSFVSEKFTLWCNTHLQIICYIEEYVWHFIVIYIYIFSFVSYVFTLYCTVGLHFTMKILCLLHCLHCILMTYELLTNL
jgi:hypothetical protein